MRATVPLSFKVSGPPPTSGTATVISGRGIADMSVDLETTHHGITVLICCHNSRTRLPAVLEHLLRQDAPAAIGWEVLVIDNASSDATSDVARSIWPDSHPVPLRVVLEPNLGLTNARNLGVAEAKYDIISFVDDDNWVGPEFVRTVHSLMQNRPEMGACGCRIEEACEVDPPGWFNAFKLGLALSPEDETYGWIVDPDKFLPGAGLSVRQAAFRDILALGFTPTLSGRSGKSLLSGEDLELGAALRLAGWKLWREESVTIKHFMPAGRLTWGYMKRLHYGFGASGFSPYEVLLFAKESPLKQSLKTTFLWQVLFTTKRGLLAILPLAQIDSEATHGRFLQLERAWFAGRLAYLVRNWSACRKNRKAALRFLKACCRDDGRKFGTVQTHSSARINEL
jgi:glycosyltransferase involved in cell wall biosynthesis